MKLISKYFSIEFERCCELQERYEETKKWPCNNARLINRFNKFVISNTLFSKKN